MITHLDLFSGIGGFSLAVDRVWGRENVKHIFCDNERFCQEVIKKHWPNSEIYGDIRELVADANEWESNTRNESESRVAPHKKFGTNYTDILTAGVPCQPASQAGRRKGTEDDRWLWPATFEVIRLTKPKWVILENVRGLLTLERGVVFQDLLSELEGIGYEYETFIIPACAVNAPHRRDRVWIIANRTGERLEGCKGDRKLQSTECLRQNRRNTPDPKSRQSGKQTEQERRKDFERGNWEKDWAEVATRLCRVDDGVSTWVDGRGKVRNSRNERLKALGNAIVPQVAIEIMKAIKRSEDLIN